MGDLLLVAHGLMKLALLVGVIVLVATAPSPAIALGMQPKSSADTEALGTGCIEADEPNHCNRPRVGRCIPYVDDDNWMESDGSDPGMNLDGTPMNGDLDLNGNSFGDCGGPFDWSGSSSSTWD